MTAKRLILSVAGARLPITRYSMDEEPEEGAMGIVDGESRGEFRRSPCVFRNGQWRTLKGKALTFQPICWYRLDRLDRDVR